MGNLSGRQILAGNTQPREIRGKTAVYRFRVEVSDDRKEWRVIEDMKENRTPVSRYEIQTDAGKVKGRFVRISFMDNTQQIPAALAEVTVLGFVRE